MVFACHSHGRQHNKKGLIKLHIVTILLPSSFLDFSEGTKTFMWLNIISWRDVQTLSKIVVFILSAGRWMKTTNRKCYQATSRKSFLINFPKKENTTLGNWRKVFYHAPDLTLCNRHCIVSGSNCDINFKNLIMAFFRMNKSFLPSQINFPVKYSYCFGSQLSSPLHNAYFCHTDSVSP